jgi:hypothetical protein
LSVLAVIALAVGGYQATQVASDSDFVAGHADRAPVAQVVADHAESRDDFAAGL